MAFLVSNPHTPCGTAMAARDDAYQSVFDKTKHDHELCQSYLTDARPYKYLPVQLHHEHALQQ